MAQKTEPKSVKPAAEKTVVAPSKSLLPKNEAPKAKSNMCDELRAVRNARVAVAGKS